MIFSDRLLFLHVPKAGGSSVSRYLMEVLPKPVYYSVPADHEADVPDGVTRIDGVAHESLAEARSVLAEQGRQLEDFEVIVACARDPYELEVSRSAFLQRDFKPYNHGLEQALAVLGDFELFAACSRPHGGRPLETYFVLDAVMPPNLRIVRLESIGTELPDCLAAAGIDPSSATIPHHNRSEHGHYLSYYTPAAEQAVYDKYRWLFHTGLYARLDLGDGPGEHPALESEAAVDALVESRLEQLDEADYFGQANVWLAAAGIHGRSFRTEAKSEALDHALDNASRTGSSHLVGRVVQEIARCWSLSGMGTAGEGIEKCTTLLETPDGWRGHAGTRYVLAELLAATGRFEDARTICRTAAADGPLGAATRTWMSTTAAFVELLADDAEAAEAHFRRGWWHAPDRVEAAYRLGRYDEADRLAGFAELTAVGAKSEARWRRIRAKLLARAGDFTAAGAFAQAATSTLRRCNDTNAEADGLTDFAEVLGLSGSESEAAAVLQQALGLYERKGNVASARRAARLLEATRQRPVSTL